MIQKTTLPIHLSLDDEAATQSIGGKIGPFLKAGDVICLTGPLGAGKSTLARAMIKVALKQGTGHALGKAVEDDIPSPTFTMVECYDGGANPIYHYDLYRLDKAEDIIEIGLIDNIHSAITIIEWAERIAHMLPPSALILSLTSKDDPDKRQLTILGADEWPERFAKII